MSEVASSGAATAAAFDVRVGFDELVLARHRSLRQQGSEESFQGPERRAFERLLAQFEAQNGAIVASFFGARNPVGVAVTELSQMRDTQLRRFVLRSTGRGRRPGRTSLHRSTSWAEWVPSEIEAALSEGDLLAVQANAALRDGSARTVVLRIFAAQTYLLELIDRGLRTPVVNAAERGQAEAET